VNMPWRYVFVFLLTQYWRNLGVSITGNHVLQVLCLCRKGALVVRGSLVVRRWWRSKQLRLVVIARAGYLLYVYNIYIYIYIYICGLLSKLFKWWSPATEWKRQVQPNQWLTEKQDSRIKLTRNPINDPRLALIIASSCPPFLCSRDEEKTCFQVGCHV
jgi:hypothetical protein